MKSNLNIFWFTGMSGAGKTTLSSYVKRELEGQGYSVANIDGDRVREKYDIPLGFNRKDIEKNNMLVAKFVEEEGDECDVIMVSIISPIDKVRKRIREMLSPNFYLVYVMADIESLKRRDPKGLYKKADEKKITDLIGYSDGNPYDVPVDADLVVDTSEEAGLEECQTKCLNFISKKL